MHDEALSFTVESGRNPDTTILKLAGPLTLQNLFAFQAEFRALKPQTLIVDLSGSPYMDSAGLGLIVNAHVSAEDSNRKLLVACVNERVQALFAMTKVDTVLHCFPTVAAAEESLSAQ